MNKEDKLPIEINGENIETLVNAFGSFNEAAAALNATYRKLEERIELLTQQLEEKDAELYTQLRELDRVTRYLNSLLESISSGVVAIDLDASITIFNRAAVEMTGIAAEDAIGKPYEEIFPESADLSLIETLTNGPELRGVERVLPGEGLHVQVGTTWVVDSYGERIGVVEVFDDISTLKRLEERLEHQKTLTALGEMAAAVAHELRNPLSGIGGFAALLASDLADDPDKLRLVKKITQGVKDLDKVATNLLFLTRRTELQHAEVDLKILINDIKQLLESETQTRELAVSISANLPDESVTVVADPELIKMALTNLGRNALIALGDEGEVSFRLTWQLLSNKVAIEVRDNGCGMTDEVRSKLFSPFFTTRPEGTGLGLALVKKAVDLHKGSIDVESEVGVGSAFRINLPIRQRT